MNYDVALYLLGLLCGTSTGLCLARWISEFRQYRASRKPTE